MAGEKDFSHRSLIEKLGVKQGHRVSLLGVNHQGFVAELRTAGAELSVGRRRKQSDHIFLAVESMADLTKIGGLEPSMARNGAAWVVFPKGRKDLREADVIRAGVAAGLVDNKVVRFSDTHTALRFVIPLGRRGGPGGKQPRGATRSG
ncbi:MAG TPA: hypothetical protein VGL18_02575 [Actinomycetota bacterium]